MILKEKTTLLICSGLLLLAIAVRVICFVGLIGSDDLNYNRSAYEIATKTFTPQIDHQRMRLGLLLPVAAAFKFLGVNEFSSLLFPFGCFLVTFSMLVYIGTIALGKWIGIVAGILYIFLPVELFDATMLLPDLPAATFVLLSGALFYLTPGPLSSTRRGGSSNDLTPPLLDKERGQGVRLSCGGLFLSGLLLGWAYLIRETAIFFAIFIGGCMAYHVWRRKTVPWRWLWFWGGLLSVFGAECGYYYLTTGTPFYRYVTIESGHNLSVLALYDRVHGWALLRRLTLDQLRVLFDVPNFNFYYFFILAGIIYAIQKRMHGVYYFSGWLLTFFLLFNFASTSLVEYYPIRSIPRYFIALTCPGLIIMAWYLRETAALLAAETRAELRPWRYSLGIPFLLMIVINVVWFSLARTIFLLGMAGLLLITYIPAAQTWIRLRIPPKQRAVVLPLLLLYLSLLPGIYTVAQREHPGQKLTCERELRGLFEFPLTHTIYTDSRTEAILEYFYEYQAAERIRPFDELDRKTVQNAYLIANWERLFFLNRLYRVPIPDYVYHPLPQWKLKAQIGGYVNPCLIYEIP